MHSSASPLTRAEESDALSIQLPQDAQSQGPDTVVHVRTKRNFPGNLSHSPFRVAQEKTLGHESKGRGHSNSLHQQKTKSPRQGAMQCWGALPCGHEKGYSHMALHLTLFLFN